MSRITLNSNIPALQANRRLGKSTSALKSSFDKLSSGLRINRASDDAAGLAIADNLRIDAKVGAQGVRNANDGISLLSVAEGAVTELSNILIRIRELASQSATGAVTDQQRQSINEEAQALVSEYNRIIETTEFNDLNVTDASLSNVGIQVGYGEKGSIAISAGQGLANVQETGTGEFGSATGVTGNRSGAGFFVADFNNDGNLDFASGESGSNTVAVNGGDGSAGFSDLDYLSENNTVYSVNGGDFLEDGNVDLVIGSEGEVSIWSNDGNGSFSLEARESAPSGGAVGALGVADFDNDGHLDVLVADLDSDAVGLLLGDGSGQLNVSGDISAGVDLAVGDFNNDGNADYVAIEASGDLTAWFGDGGGGFNDTYIDNIGAGAGLQVADVDNDGNDDIGFILNGEFSVAISEGGGGFNVSSTGLSSDGDMDDFNFVDVNGDGLVDVVATGSGEGATALNGGSGDFSETVTFGAVNLSVSDVATGDFDNDGFVDVISGGGGSAPDLQLGLFAQTSNSQLTNVNLLTQSSALSTMEVVDQALVRVSDELGRIGSVVSRLTTAVNNLQQSNENLRQAESSIRDVDTATEAANLVRNQILQQSAQAILSQANQLPALALNLIGQE